MGIPLKTACLNELFDETATTGLQDAVKYEFKGEDNWFRIEEKGLFFRIEHYASGAMSFYSVPKITKAEYSEAWQEVSSYYKLWLKEVGGYIAPSKWENPFNNFKDFGYDSEPKEIIFRADEIVFIQGIINSAKRKTLDFKLEKAHEREVIKRLDHISATLEKSDKTNWPRMVRDMFLGIVLDKLLSTDQAGQLWALFQDTVLKLIQ